MLSRLALLLMVACGSCMEMRETVERMVMVHTTGSDLQPAATGYIYQKKNDGKESVIEMGESEVMEHLAKLYEQPKAFAAPIPIAKALHIVKEEDDDKSDSQSEERVIPVKEKQEDHVDGIADEDFKKIFDEYMSLYGDNKAYDDYVRSLEHSGDGPRHGHKDEKQDDDGFEEYEKKYKYGKTNPSDYHNEKYESYAYSGKGHKEGQIGAKDYLKHYEHDHPSVVKTYDHDDTHGFHKLFDSDSKEQKGHKIYDNENKNDFHKFTNEHKYHGADSEEKTDYKPAHDDFGKIHHEGSGTEHDHSSEEDSSGETHGDYKSEGRQTAGYGFEVEH